MTDHEHAQSHGPRHGHGPGGTAELLDLDGEVLHDWLTETTGWVAGLAGGPVRRVLDGAGTGTGTFALLERFAGCDVVALDVDASLLDHLVGSAARLGVADRVRGVRADLDGEWPDLAPVDLVWASSSLHHVADPDRALAAVRDVLRPGGTLAVVESASFPRFLPDDVGQGLEARCHSALAEARADHVPHQGSDWGARLSRAGFAVEGDRVFTVGLTAPLPAAAGRYAQLSLARARTGLAGRLPPGDLALLDALLDEHRPEGLLHRPDLTVRATRSGWVARRP